MTAPEFATRVYKKQIKRTKKTKVEMAKHQKGKKVKKQNINFGQHQGKSAKLDFARFCHEDYKLCVNFFF